MSEAARTVGGVGRGAVRRVWPSLVVLAVLLAGAAAIGAAPEAYADVRPELRAEVGAETAGELNTYEIAATLDAEAGTIGGTARVGFVNDAAARLDEVYFRLYPNAAYYGEGGLTVEGVRADGTAIEPTLEVDETALRVPLPEPVAPGEMATVELAFETTVPVDSPGSYGIFQRDSVDGTWILDDWHPVLAVYEEGVGWRIDPPTEFGDPTFAASALYDVSLTAPPGLRVVASGVETEERQRGDAVERRFVAGPVREFTLVADDDYAVSRREVGGTTVTVHAEPELAEATRVAALAVAAEALEVFGARFGPYPFAELDLVQTRLGGALAVSWSGLVFLDGETLLEGMAADDPAAFATVVAHEVAHLWWGAAVGSNSNDHTFVNEGLATLSSILYLEETASPEAVAVQRAAWVTGPARRLLARGDAVVDLPIAAGQDGALRSWAFYGKAALGFLTLREEVGDTAFDAALREFAETHRFAIAEPDDLLAAFEAASGEELDGLWRRWFAAAVLTEEEIERIEAG